MVPGNDARHPDDSVCDMEDLCWFCEVVPISWTLEWERSPLVVKYSREQRLRAVRLYEQYDRSAASVISELGVVAGANLFAVHSRPPVSATEHSVR